MKTSKASRKARPKPVKKRTAHRTAKPAPQALATITPQPEKPWHLSEDEIIIVKNSIAKGASDQELQFCLTVAKRYRLDPFKQQIWFVKRWDKSADAGNGVLGTMVWTPQVGINGLLFIAGRDHRDEFGSVSLPEFGPIVSGHPEWAIVKIWKKGASQPTEAQAWWDEYAPADLTKAPFWKKMPRRMIAKCATALAIRQAYPDLGGLYIPEEMERMAEEHTENGRAIIEQTQGSLTAAQEIAKQKIAQHAQGQKITVAAVETQSETEDLKRYEQKAEAAVAGKVVEMTAAMTGDIPIWEFSASEALAIMLENGLKDCSYYNDIRKCRVMGADDDEALAKLQTIADRFKIKIVKHFAPAAKPVAASLPQNTAATGPILKSVSPIQKRGKANIFDVEWDGKKAGCFHIDWQPFLAKDVGKPAFLKVVQNGKWWNLEEVLSTNGVPWHEGAPMLVQETR